MEIEFDLTYDDWLAAQKSTKGRMESLGRRIGIGILIVILWIILSVIYFTPKPILNDSIIGVFVVLFLLVPAICIGLLSLLAKEIYSWLKLRRWNQRILEMTEQGDLNNQRAAISPDFFTYVQTDSAFSLRWRAIKRIITDENHVYIVVTAESTYFVPKRAFAKSEDFDRFVALANEYWNAGNAAEDR